MGIKESQRRREQEQNVLKDGKQPNKSEPKETSGEKEQIKEKRMRQNLNSAVFLS